MTHVNPFMPLGGSLAGTLPNPGLSADAAIQRQVFGQRPGAWAFSRSVFEQVTTLTADVSVTTPTLIGSSNIIEQRNGANAQAFRVYGTYTDASNYTRCNLGASASSVSLFAESAGTGSANMDVSLTPKGTGNVSMTFSLSGSTIGSIKLLQSANSATYYLGGDGNAGNMYYTSNTRPGSSIGDQNIASWVITQGAADDSFRVFRAPANGVGGALTFTNILRLSSVGGLAVTGNVTSSNPTAGIGYATGAGGTVTQLTSKSTGVTLNTVCGRITMQAAALAAAAKVSFVVTNSACAATDVPLACVASGGTANAYRAEVTAVAGAGGAFTITVENITAGSLSEAPVIGFSILKAVTA